MFGARSGSGPRFAGGSPHPAGAPMTDTASGGAVPALEVTDLTVRFAGLTALDSVSFTVQPGSVHALIGPNGAGKSTSFNVLSGVYRATSGSVRFGESELTGLLPTASPPSASPVPSRTSRSRRTPRSPTACCSAGTGSPAPGSSPPGCGCRPPPARRANTSSGYGRSRSSPDSAAIWTGSREHSRTESRSSSNSAAPCAWSRGCCSSTSPSPE